MIRSLHKVSEALIKRVTFDEEADAGYIYVQRSGIYQVDANIIGVRHGETLGVETQFWTNIDTDNFDRLMGIEILAPGEIKTTLQKHAMG